MKGQGFNLGTHHFGLLQEQGHKNDQTHKRAAPWFQPNSEDTFGGKDQKNPNREARGAAVKTWAVETKETEVAVGLWYSVVEPAAFKKQQELRQFLVDEGTGLETHSRCQFSTLTVQVENEGVEPHKDGGDAADSFTFGTAHDVGAGSVDVCFPEIGHRVKLLEGDTLGCRANLLDHCVTEVRDPRGIILYAMKQSRDKLKQHVNFLPDVPEKDAIFAAKSKRGKEKKEKLEQCADQEMQHIQQSSQEQTTGGTFGTETLNDLQADPNAEHDYRRVEIPKHPNKLQKARVEKRKAVQSLERNEALASEILAEENKPVLDSYVYNNTEEARRVKGLNPYIAATAQKSWKKRKADTLDEEE